MNPENSGQQLVIHFGRELDLFLAKLVTKGMVFTGVLVIVTLIQMLMYGMTSRHLLLVGGGILSGLDMFGYVYVIVRDEEAGAPRKSFASMLIGFGGLVPYLFGVYLLFYEGLWRFTRLLDEFLISTIIAAGFYLFSGYMIVLAIYKISEFGRAVGERRIVIQRTT